MAKKKVARTETARVTRQKKLDGELRARVESVKDKLPPEEQQKPELYKRGEVFFFSGQPSNILFF